MSNMLIKKYQKEIKTLKEKCNLIDQIRELDKSNVDEFNRYTEAIERLESCIKDLKHGRFIKLTGDYGEYIYKTNAPDEEIEKAINFYHKVDGVSDYTEVNVVQRYLKNKGYYFKYINIDTTIYW